MPLGLPANRATRNARQAAHAAFDPFWRVRNQFKKGARREAYRWLRTAMAIPKAQCHIGMFTVEQCAQVIALCAERRHLKGVVRGQGSEVQAEA